MDRKKVAMASDHAAYDKKEYLKIILTDRDYDVVDFGTHDTESCDYPDFAHPAAEAVEKGKCAFGVCLCGSGNGMQMTLNKHQGIRAALCWTPEIARLAKQHNNANILVLPGRFLTDEEAKDILLAYIDAEFEGGRHQRRIDKIPVC